MMTKSFEVWGGSDGQSWLTLSKLVVGTRWDIELQRGDDDGDDSSGGGDDGDDAGDGGGDGDDGGGDDGDDDLRWKY